MTLQSSALWVTVRLDITQSFNYVVRSHLCIKLELKLAASELQPLDLLSVVLRGENKYIPYSSLVWNFLRKRLLGTHTFYVTATWGVKTGEKPAGKFIRWSQSLIKGTWQNRNAVTSSSHLASSPTRVWVCRSLFKRHTSAGRSFSELFLRWNGFTSWLWRVVKTCVSECLADISTAHHLKLNLSKTELLFIPGKDCSHMDLSVTVEDVTVSPCRDTVQLLVEALVMSRLDYCNSQPSQLNLCSVSRTSSFTNFPNSPMWPTTSMSSTGFLLWPTSYSRRWCWPSRASMELLLFTSKHCPDNTARQEHFAFLHQLAGW